MHARASGVFLALSVAVLAIAAVAGVATAVAGTAQAPAAPAAGPAWTADLAAIRTTAGLIPGPRARRLNVVKFAESRRTKNFSVKGAPAEPSVQARTAFQLVFDGGTVMVDSGMTRRVHAFFGRGVEEPYDEAAAQRVARAVAAARLVLLTHEHGDHVGGVIDTPEAAALAPKTILTRTQLQTLVSTPQMPEIRLTPEAAARYVTVDYERYFPAAPGVALVKAGGHTPGSQMVYVALESGREYLLIGDAAWHMDDVRQVAGKDAPWVTEDKAAVMDQLRWLNGLARTAPDLIVVASHDDELRRALVAAKLLGDGLE